jgi:hypothetical protein
MSRFNDRQILKRKKKGNKNHINGRDINERVEQYLGSVSNYVVPDTIYRFKGIIAPDRLFTHLEYSFGSYNIMPAATTGTLLVAGNSPYDPDKTGTGTQPFGFVQWSALYGRYRVRRSRILIANTSTTVPYRLTCTPTTDTSLPSTVEQGLQNPYTSNYSMSTSLQKYFVDSSMETAKIYGVTSIAQQSGFSGAVSGDPTSLWYWRIRAAVYDGVTSATAYAQVLIVYEVEFYQRLNLTS